MKYIYETEREYFLVENKLKPVPIEKKGYFGQQ